MKKLEEALKKATIAAAVRGTSGAFAQYRAVGDKLALARGDLKAAPNADGVAAKQEPWVTPSLRETRNEITLPELL